jgi:AmmeMemoRadiSam system protein A
MTCPAAVAGGLSRSADPPAAQVRAFRGRDEHQRAESRDRSACRLRVFRTGGRLAYAPDPAARRGHARHPAWTDPSRAGAVSPCRDRAFATPLGEVVLDAAAIRDASALPQVIVSDDAHAAEHALEVQLPFLQSVLGTFTLVPLAVGRATPDDVAAVLDVLWGGRETLIVVSSDLSHYHAYADAQRIDRNTADTILALPKLDHEQACGATPINGLLACARRRGLEPALLDLRNSATPPATGRGSSATRRSRSPIMQRDTELGETLLAIARAAIRSELDLGEPLSPDHASLGAPAATFVTLRIDDRLRGCVGSVEARRPLGEDVRANAIAAAFRDPRFPPLASGEFESTSIEVSLLSAAERVDVEGEDDLLALLRPGVDGVILAHDGRRATFLPQVWASFAEPRAFVALMRKAGLPADGWNAKVRLARYTVASSANGRRCPSDAMNDFPGRWWHPLSDGRIQCDLCPRDCRLHEDSAAPASCASARTMRWC